MSIERRISLRDYFAVWVCVLGERNVIVLESAAFVTAGGRRGGGVSAGWVKQELGT